MRPAAAAIAVVCLLVCCAGCGGSGDDSGSSGATPGGGQTLEELWRAPGDDVAVVPGTATHEVGDVRFSFVVVDAEGRVVTLPTARLWIARGLKAKPFHESSAQLERVGVPGGAEADATHLYVARVRLPEPGKYWILAEPEGGGSKVQALGDLEVSRGDAVPSPGDRAPASQTPTLASVRGKASRITTRTPPDRTLLEHSVADSLRAGVPFVLVFSTPKFCTSRTCGPTVDVVEEVARRFEGRDIRFIHVEVFEDNDPALGYNRWMKEWKLATEPWTFLVGADGRVVERFEGAVSVRELEEAVAAELGS
jgi:hypothetical protein